MIKPVFLHTNKQIITALTSIRIIVIVFTVWMLEQYKPMLPLNQSEIQTTSFLATQLICDCLTLKPS